MPKDYIKWIRSKVGHDPVILVAVVAIIEDEQGNILAVRRGDRKEEFWGLVGGMMEIGESAQETIQREVREESGIDISIKYFQGAYSNRGLEKYPNGDIAQVVLFVFVCSKNEGEMEKTDGRETINFKYIGVDQAKKIMPHHSLVLDDYTKRLRGVIR